MNGFHSLNRSNRLRRPGFVLRLPKLAGLILLALAANASAQVDFATQVAPLFSGNGGCSINACHGNLNSGQMKLNSGIADSLYNEVVNEVGPRGRKRTDVSNLPNSAANSLILLMPSGQNQQPPPPPPITPQHGGDVRPDWSVGESAYNLTLQWVREGAFRFLAPTNLTAAAAQTGAQVTLTWTDRSTGETRFRLERREGSGNFVFLVNAAAEAQNFTDNTVQPNTTYTYRLRAENAVGVSNFATSNTVTTPGGNRPPNVANAIANQNLTVGGTFTRDLNTAPAVFNDPDGDALTYNASSNAPAIATASVTGSMLTVTALAGGSAIITVTANDGKGGANSTTFTVAVNRPPVVANAIPNQPLTVGGAFTRNLNAAPAVFSDPDGDALSYSATSSATSTATANVTGNILTVTAAGGGSATITVTANDGKGGTQSTTFTVTVNQPPRLANAMANQTLTVGRSFTRDLNAPPVVFVDPDGDALSYTATSSAPAIASAAISGSTLTVTLNSSGTATITVTANDGRGGTAQTSFTVSTNRAPVVANAIANQTLILGDVPFQRDLNAAPAVFTDPDGDALSYTAGSNASAIAAATISGSHTAAGVLTVTAAAIGTATITVTADDGKGSTTATTFTATVTATTRVVRPTGVSALKGRSVDVPVTMLAQGNENALGFSLVFDPQILSNPQARLGADAGAATFFSNAAQQNQGRFGLALTLPTGQTFAAGLRELFVVSFLVNSATGATSTQIGFGSQPIPQEVVDASANALSTDFTPATLIITGVKSNPVTAPVVFALEQNFPNPFSLGDPSTTIPFSLPASGHVVLKIYNLSGEEVAVLIDRTLAAGRHELRWQSGELKNGVYFYRLQMGALSQTRKLVLMR